MEVFTTLQTVTPSYAVFNKLSRVLATHAHKDMNWKAVLSSPDRDKAIRALEAEVASLQSTILTKISPDDPDFAVAVELATPGRVLLDIKQGFKEDRLQADGPDFNYYAHVAKLVSVKVSLFRPNRGSRRVAIKDVCTAFLESDKYPDGVVKYVCIKDSPTLQWEYLKQSEPIYGEACVVIRWEDIIVPWYESKGFPGGENEPRASASWKNYAIWHCHGQTTTCPMMKRTTYGSAGLNTHSA